MKVGDIDLSSPDSFVERVPHDYFALLRKEAPVSWQPRAGGTGFWSITRYQDIVEIERNTEVFSSRTNISPLPTPESTIKETVDKSIILSDPPRHTFLRRSIMSGFSPKALAKLEQRIEQCAIEAIDAVIEKGECDWHDVAAYTPIEIVCDILGVPAYDRQNFYDWANAMFGQSDPELSSPMGNMLGGLQMFSYARRMAQDRRANPGEDVFSLISLAEEDGERLTEADLGASFIVFATAGNETTRTQFLHGTKLLIEHPEAMAALREDISLLPNALEEMLRFSSPVNGMARLATRDYELHGQTIKKGDQVMMWFTSGNRDETVFENPDQFDIHRSNAKNHMAFGSNGGIHRCLGAMLARKELTAMFTALVSRIPDIQLNGKVGRLRSNFTNGIKEMPVKFTPQKAIGDTSHVKMYATGKSNSALPAPAAPEPILQPVDGHEIQLVPLAKVSLELGIPQVIPEGPKGTRLMVEVHNATWQGERLTASQISGPAGDWALVDSDGTLNIDVRATIVTNDGATIFVSYEGRSDYMQAGAAPLIITPKFETNDARYKWLNKVQAVGRGKSEGMGKLVYDIYEVR